MDRGVEFPWMRAELLENLYDLSDRDFQRRIWIEHKYPHENYYADFDMVIHYLYDDTQVATDPYDWIGAVLRDEREAEAMVPVGRAIDRLLDELGKDKTDKEYIESPLWDDVVRAARAAFAIIDRPEDRHESSDIPEIWPPRDDEAP